VVRGGTALGTETTGTSPPVAIAATSTAGTVAPQDSDSATPDGPSTSQSPSAAAAPNIGNGGRRASRVPEGSNGGSDGPSLVAGIVLVPVIVFVVGLLIWLGRDKSPDAGKSSSRTPADNLATTAAMLMFMENTHHTQTPPVYQPPSPPIDTSSSGGDVSGGSSGGDGGASGSW
jgi:hypothetical protein